MRCVASLTLAAMALLAAPAMAEDKIFHPGEDVSLSDSVWGVGRAMEMGKTLHANNELQEDANTTNGRFVMVLYGLQNNGKKTDRLFIRPALVDSQGREYEEYDKESFYIPKNCGAETIGMTQLTPGVVKVLAAIYEVPENAKGLMFRARSLASDKETALIALDICPDCGGKGDSNRECPSCKGSGHDSNYDECKACGGSGKARCAKCKGTGVLKAGGPAAKAPEKKPETPEDRARSLMSVAEQFANNKMVDRAVEKFKEVVQKYPDTEAAKDARKRIEELQGNDSPKK